jgi:hypothetical protein
VSVTQRLRILKPNIGARLVFHAYNGDDCILLYVFRRPEGTHVVLDLEMGDLVDFGQFNEGTERGMFQYYTEWADE